ncbi:hypothetical protein BSKO_00273 [Bryopsis sp. KO-2023]|nr:hypothetical protein BSKO_00273 [Bryopsis sp. KO-2023]
MLARMNVSSVQHARFLGTPLVVRTTVARCSAKARPEASTVEPKEVAKFTAASAVAATLLSSGNALAAQEVAQLAAGDNRLGALLFLLVPALGWVLFNIGGPASRQLDDMSGKKSIIGALGLGAAGLALTADQAEAATQVAQVAGSDNRLGALLLLLGPAVGWVLFNIGGPASRQLDTMSKKGVVAGLGLGAATMLAAQNAEAAQQIGSIAAGDNRLGALLFLLVPAIGWVLFNIGGPASRQLDDMSGKKKK